jgi:CBS domain-containing protein
MHELLPSASDLMTKEYLSVHPSLSLVEAVERLAHDPEDTAFVIDDLQRLVGLLTEKECLHVLAARVYDEAVVDTVEDVMCRIPTVLTPKTDVYAIAQAFHGCSCAVLPVIEDSRVLGAVSQVAMLRALLAVIRHRSATHGTAEQTAEDMKQRPGSIERMQRVFGSLDRDQLSSLLRRQQ